MSQGKRPEKGHTKSTSKRVAKNDDTPKNVVRDTKTIKIESHDEVYYPVVNMIDPKAIRVEIPVKFTKKTSPSEIQPRETIAEKSSTSSSKESPIIDVSPTASIASVASAPLIISTPKDKTRRRRGIKVVFSKIATLSIAVVAVAAVALVGLRLFGFRTFTVMSGSMEPSFPVGSLIYVKPVDYQELKVGDVISYVASDDKTVVTHRISSIEIDKNDSTVRRFQTKGDANAVADTKLVHYKNVLGTPVVTIPYIGYFAHNIQQPPGIYIALVVGTLLLAWTFLPGTLEGRRRLQAKSAA